VGSGFALRSSCPTVTGVGCKVSIPLTVSRRRASWSADRNKTFAILVDLQDAPRGLQEGVLNYWDSPAAISWGGHLTRCPTGCLMEEPLDSSLNIVGAAISNDPSL
jgi:hypothetical protein